MAAISVARGHVGERNPPHSQPGKIRSSALRFRKFVTSIGDRAAFGLPARVPAVPQRRLSTSSRTRSAPTWGRSVKTTATFRARSAAGQSRTGHPSRRASPVTAGMKPAKVRSRVDLPWPFRPSRQMNSPGSTTTCSSVKRTFRGAVRVTYKLSTWCQKWLSRGPKLQHFQQNGHY